MVGKERRELGGSKSETQITLGQKDTWNTTVLKVVKALTKQRCLFVIIEIVTGYMEIKKISLTFPQKCQKQSIKLTAVFLVLHSHNNSCKCNFIVGYCSSSGM